MRAIHVYSWLQKQLALETQQLFPEVEEEERIEMEEIEGKGKPKFNRKVGDRTETEVVSI